MASAEYEKFYQTLKEKAPKGDFSIAQIRQGFEKMMADFPAAKDVHFKEFSIGKQTAYWVRAPKVSDDRAILFFHGGAYSAGSTLSHQDMLGRLSQAAGMPILSVDYRLAPEHPFPAAVYDALEAYEFLLKTLRPDQIILAGSSAGGGLMIALLLTLKDKKIAMPKGAVGICPWVDLGVTGKTIQSNAGKDILDPERIKKAAEVYLAGGHPKNPQASPLYGDLTGLPPMLVQAGGRDLLLDENEKFAERAKHDKVKIVFEVFPDMFHNWQLFAAKIPEGQQAIDKIGSYIKGLK